MGKGARRGLIGPTLAAFGVVVLLVCAIFAFLLNAVRDMQDDAARASRSERAVVLISRLNRLAIDMETGIRGRLITGEGKRLLDELRVRFDGFRNSELALSEDRRAAADRAADRAVAAAVARLLAAGAHAKGLELSALIAPDVPRGVRGDRGRVAQILTNLLSNAVRFTPEGEVAVEVGVEDATEHATTVRVTVGDTGIGIRRRDVDRLFESFQQADASTTRRCGGTGVGLTISRQLAEMMGRPPDGLNDLASELEVMGKAEALQGRAARLEAAWMASRGALRQRVGA